MQKIIDDLDKLSGNFSNALFKISTFAMIVWPFIMVCYILLRYFGITWVFVEEFTEYWQVLIVFFSLTYVLRAGKHISIDMLINKLPDRVKVMAKLIIYLITFCVMLYLLNKSIVFLKFGILSRSRSFTTNIVLWPVYMLVPIGLVSFSLEVFVVLCKMTIGYFTKKPKN